MKQLSVILPVHNAESDLEKCLISLCGIDDRIEVIIVNDKSSDRSMEIAGDYKKRFPSYLAVIDTDAKGIGDCFHYGLAVAKGRYVKLVRPSDRFCTDQLSLVLDKMEDCGADVLITGRELVNLSTGQRTEYSPRVSCNNRQIDMIKLLDKYDEVYPCLEFSSLCYKTEFLRQKEFRLSEDTGYVFQEYSILPFITAHSMMIFPEVVYEQKAEPARSRVYSFSEIRRVIAIYRSYKPMGKARDEFLKKRIARMILNNYYAFLVVPDNRKEGWKKAEELKAYIDQNEPSLAKLTDRKYKSMKRLGKYRLAAKVAKFHELTGE